MEVILKTIPYTPTLPVTTSTNELIPVEIDNLLKLSHPNIQRLLDYSYRSSSKTWTMTLEYSSSWDLLSDVIRSRALKEDEVRDIIRQLLSAIVHCFNHGVDHRDVSINNVYLDRKTNKIKLGNFHHSTMLSVLPHFLKPPSSSPSSTPPELYRQGFFSPHSAAVWSVGCLLFELLSGSKPLLSTADVALNNVRWEMLSPRSISCEVYSLMLRCLNPNTEHRIPFKELVKHPWIINETLV